MPEEGKVSQMASAEGIIEKKQRERATIDNIVIALFSIAPSLSLSLSLSLSTHKDTVLLLNVCVSWF